jgi:flavodoxin short chain
MTRKERVNTMNIAVVYWSGTGNTEAMANAVLKGIREAGADGTLLEATDFDADAADSFDAIAFGCPSMGVEELEESEFEPMFASCEANLSGKRIVLFGSYGWGDGEWMRNWEDRCRADEAVLVAESVICNDAPDDNTLSDCRNLGAALAK